MEEFIKRLGKSVQRLWNKIFGKKEEYDPLSPEANGLWKNFISDGIFYIDGKPIGEVKAMEVLSAENSDCYKELDKQIKALQNTIDKDFELVFDSSTGKNELEKYFSISRTFLPKHYWCKTLIVSIAANQPYEYQSMDISQLEEHGIAHFVLGRTIGFQEIEEEYRRESKLEEEEEIEERVNWLREGAETGLCSMIYGPADLYYYEELGYWDFD